MERCARCGAVAWSAIDVRKGKTKIEVRVPLCRECIALLYQGRDIDARPS